MPTGLNAPLVDGEDTSLRGMLVRCAYQYGALVQYRDSNIDRNELPEKARPMDQEREPYQVKALRQYKAEKESFTAKTREQQQQEMDAFYQGQVRQWWETKNEHDEIFERVKKVRDEALAWEPPTEDHVNYKEFVISQIDSAIEHDCRYAQFNGPEDDPHGPRQQRLDDWIDDKLDFLDRIIEMYEKDSGEAEERVEEAQDWLDNLREALPPKQEAATP